MTGTEQAPSVQAVQVTGVGELAGVPGAGKNDDLLRSQEITLRGPAKSPGQFHQSVALGGEKGAHIVRTPDVDEQLAVRWTAPVVVDGQIVTHPVRVSPLDPDESGRYPTSLRGGVVDDSDEIERIRARIQYAALPMWQRVITTNPEARR